MLETLAWTVITCFATALLALSRRIAASDDGRRLTLMQALTFELSLTNIRRWLNG